MSGPGSRVAVVTGGASGIGLGAARQLAADGNRVALLDLNGAAAHAAAAELQGAIVLTVMPCRARSTASALVSAMTPPLDAA